MRTGSLCSGIGGLDEAVLDVFGGTLAWQAELDRDASTVLAARYPGTPNLGDLTAVDWAHVEPVDVLCAGFPCQPVSQAGARSGINDERWLFDDILTAISRMDPHPSVCVFENVPGLLTANDGDAMARVVEGLACLGYMGSWRTVRASDVGAPHRRARIFLVASDPRCRELQRRRERRVMAGPSGTPESERGQRQWGWDAAGDSHAAAADTDSFGSLRAGEPRRRGSGPANHGQPASDADEPGLERPQPAGRHHMPTGRSHIARDTASNTRRVSDRDRTPAADADHAADNRQRTRSEPGPRSTLDWGSYEPAVRRWEHTLGRTAPDPLDNRGRLNPALVEWMMGYPAGWVTDLLGRSAALSCLGNAVVTPQAVHGIRLALDNLHALERTA